MKGTGTVLAAVAALLGLGLTHSFGALEARALARVDPVSSREGAIGAVAGIGYLFDESLTVGLYGSLQRTDRDLPKRMSRMYGLGAYAEYDLTVGYRLLPFVGASLGMIETTGAGYGTAFHGVGAFGLKYAIMDNLCLSVSLNGHWASEALFDYERHENDWEAHRTDITVDAGVRLLF